MRLRFTIRDLLWLTLVVGLLTAWRKSIPGHAAPLESLIRTNRSKYGQLPPNCASKVFSPPPTKGLD